MGLVHVGTPAALLASLHLRSKVVQVLKGFRIASHFSFSGKDVLEGFHMLLNILPLARF